MDRRIWTEGFYRSEFSDGDLLGSTELDEYYGIDDERLVPDIQTQNHIEVPRVSINLTEQQLTYIQQHFQVMDKNDNSYVMNTFCSLVEYLEGIKDTSVDI